MLTAVMCGMPFHIIIALVPLPSRNRRHYDRSTKQLFPVCGQQYVFANITPTLTTTMFAMLYDAYHAAIFNNVSRLRIAINDVVVFAISNNTAMCRNKAIRPWRNNAI